MNTGRAKLPSAERAMSAAPHETSRPLAVGSNQLPLSCHVILASVILAFPPGGRPTTQLTIGDCH
jgi:hypothetical protein